LVLEALVADGVMLSMGEVDRYVVVKRVQGKELTQAAAALELGLGLSVRQVKRLYAAVP
jgi:hypothetical protein